MPPTTGIGPGLERMAMIFTGQENIDDVIFFPMMRPTVSPLNAALYGVPETTVAPVEDLALTAAEFETLCVQGAIKPHARNLLIKPHLRVWPAGAAEPRASAHVELEGFFANSVLRLAGYKVGLDTGVAEDQARQQVAGVVEATLATFLRQTFPACQVTVSPASVLRHG